MDGNLVGLEASEAGSFGWKLLGENFFFLTEIWFGSLVQSFSGVRVFP